ncbi:MAG: hypothetical protein RIG82_12010 [Phycisphaeraceae bacterium]
MMVKANMKKDGSDAVARLCRAYIAFVETPSEDVLFNWSNALHSMHDRVPKAMRSDLFKHGEFVAMKALRNHFHHGGEVTHNVKPLAISNQPLVSDLGILCLIDREVVLTAIQAIDTKYKAEQQPLAMHALKWYGQYVNLYPAIFNLMVHVILLARRYGVTSPDNEAYKRLADAVAKDEANGYPLTVSGEIYCHASSVDAFLASLMCP